MTLQIVPKEQILSPHLCGLIFGENGVGKTHVAATLIPMLSSLGKMLFINYYGNVETLLKFPHNKWDVLEGPVQFNEIQKMWTDPLLDQYEALCFDNLTGLTRDLTVDVVRQYPSGLGKDGPKSGGTRTTEAPSLGDYGLSSERLRICCTNLRNRRAKQHVIAIAHQRIEKDEDSGSIAGYPSVPGKVPAHLLSLFTETMYIKTDPSGKQEARFDKVGYYQGSTRVLSEVKYDIPKGTKDFLANLYGNILKQQVSKAA